MAFNKGINKGKAQDILAKTFKDNLKNVSEDEAEHLITKSEQKIKALDDERRNDEKLTAAKQIVKDLNGGYSSAKNYERAKIRFLLDKLEEIQSGDINPSSGANA
jgi:vacuolar-type H+-ATPase subunit I/STV1